MPESVYIHVPFCADICSYCDFCKGYYNEKFVSKYLDCLKKEIDSIYKGNVVKTIYIGGGTPNVLTIFELEKLFEIIKIFKVSDDLEFTVEANIELLTEDQLKLFFDNKVNRLSIGIQTFNDEILKKLNRHHNYEIAIKNVNLAKKYFDNINVDIMYGLPGQTIVDVRKDLDIFLKLEVPHVSLYSLIIERGTKFYIENVNNMDDCIEVMMYNYISSELQNNGYNYYEISNYAKEGFESQHNLTYWNNKEYYGFGCGASSYIDGVRIDNTRSINKYFEDKIVRNRDELTFNAKVENAFILGLRKIKGLNKKVFIDDYGIDIDGIPFIRKLVKEGKLISDECLYIKPEFIYVSNDILISFLGIDYEKYKI